MTVELLTLRDMAGLVTAVDGVGGTESAVPHGDKIVDVDELAEIGGGAGVDARLASFDGSLILEKKDLIDDDRLTPGAGAATDGDKLVFKVLKLGLEGTLL